MIEPRAGERLTADRTVVAEQERQGYTRYRSGDGRRWEVRGVCVKLGHCMIGAVIQTPRGMEMIRDLAHLEELKAELGTQRLDSEMDVPVGPGFSGCCALEITVL